MESKTPFSRFMWAAFLAILVCIFLFQSTRKITTREFTQAIEDGVCTVSLIAVNRTHEELSATLSFEPYVAPARGNASGINEHMEIALAPMEERKLTHSFGVGQFRGELRARVSNIKSTGQPSNQAL